MSGKNKSFFQLGMIKKKKTTTTTTTKKKKKEVTTPCKEVG